MKKILAISMLFAGVLAYAQESKQPLASESFSDASSYKAEDSFTSLGKTWVELNGGIGIAHNKLDGVFSNYKGGAIAAITSNLFLDKRNYFNDKITVGIDVGAGFEYSNTPIEGIEIDAYNVGAYIKPYVTFYKSRNLNVSGFISPYFAYARIEEDGVILGRNLGGDNTYNLGFVAGLEIAFLQDFYVSPAYRYMRTQSWDTAENGFDKNIIEVEVGYRIYKNISLHLRYAHDFQKEIVDVKFSSDKIIGGIRYTF